MAVSLPSRQSAALVTGLAAAATFNNVWQTGQQIARGIRGVKRIADSFGSSDPRPPSRRRKMARRMSRRRMRAPRSRRPRRRFARKTIGRRRGGQRYGRRARKVGMSLKANFQMNDRKSIRVVQNVGEISVAEGALLSNNIRFICELDSWTTEWADEIEKYTQFRMSDIQFVIKPRNIVTSGAEFRVATNQINNFAIRTVLGTDTIVPLMSIPELQQTPGVRYIPLQKKSRTIYNCDPTYQRIDTFVHSSGSSSFERVMKMGWTDITSQTKTLTLAAIEVTKPVMDRVRFDGIAGSLFWDVTVYATIHLRGNKDQLVEPQT